MYCFYHSADLDGLCSGAIVKHKFPDCKLIGIDYGEEIDYAAIDGQIVYMVDFALQPFERMIELANRSILHWIDHHPRPIAAYKESDVICEGHHLDYYAALAENPDPTKLRSGCELTWEYLYPFGPMPYAVKLLGRYDVWDHSYDQNVLPFQYGLRTKTEDLRPENNMVFWETLFEAGTAEDAKKKNVMSNRLALIADQGRCVLNYEKKQSAIYCHASAFEIQFANLPAIVINRGLPNSTQFESVYDHDRHKLMIAFCWCKKHWKFGVYSDHDDVHCGEICEVFGGGGHKGAGGFKVDRLPLAVYQAMHGALREKQSLGVHDIVCDPCP